MPRLVDREAVAFFGLNDERPRAAEYDLVTRLVEVTVRHPVEPFPRGEDGGFVHQVAQIRAGETGRGRGDLLQVDAGRQRHLARMYLEDGHAILQVRQIEY